MQSLVALPGLAIALFASTNVDDLFVLLGFFSDPKLRTRDIVVGQYAGIATLFGLSVAASLLSLVIPRANIGLLGIVPIVIGVKRFVELFRGTDGTEEGLELRRKVRGYGRTATVALVTIANGGDNIGIYTPSLAIRSGYEIAVIALVFVVMTALWCYFAYWMVNHPKLGAPIRRFHEKAPRSSPFLAPREVGSLSAGTMMRRPPDSSPGLVYFRQTKQLGRERSALTFLALLVLVSDPPRFHPHSGDPLK